LIFSISRLASPDSMFASTFGSGSLARNSWLGVALLGLLVLGLSGCAEPVERAKKISGNTMGSQYHITWFGGEAMPSEVHELVEERLAFLNAVFSTYDPNSELSQLNRRSGELVGQMVPVSPELLSVLRDADHVSRYSMGRLDITLGPLVNRWGFGPQRTDSQDGGSQAPSAAEVDGLLTHVGQSALHLDAEAVALTMDKPLTIDLSAVAKGWAVDDIGLLLEAMEISDYLVEIGGEVRTRGKKPDAPWRLAIERPQAGLAAVGQAVHRVVEPGDNAIATSGDYRNYYEEDGVRYSHTIDPLTGYPIRHRLASVTVIMPTCSLADAWATALNVAGPEAGMALAEANDLAVLMIVREGEEFVEQMSSVFSRKYANNQP